MTPKEKIDVSITALELFRGKLKSEFERTKRTAILPGLKLTLELLNQEIASYQAQAAPNEILAVRCWPSRRIR